MSELTETKYKYAGTYRILHQRPSDNIGDPQWIADNVERADVEAEAQAYISAVRKDYMGDFAREMDGELGPVHVDKQDNRITYTWDATDIMGTTTEKVIVVRIS